jgi:hypothetical protein
MLSAGALEGYSRRLEGDQNKHPSLGEALTNRSEFAEFLIPDTRFTPSTTIHAVLECEAVRMDMVPYIESHRASNNIKLWYLTGKCCVYDCHHVKPARSSKMI